MMPTGPRFDPGELRDADEPASDPDLAAALSAARELEALAGSSAVHPSSDFVDRVMKAVEREPAPTAAGLFAGVRRRPGLASLVASVRGAWALALGGAGRPFSARAAALAYVLVVAIAATSLTGIAAYGAAGALGILEPDRSSPPPTQPVESTQPSPSPEPTQSTEPSPSTAPTESAEPTETPEASSEESTEPSSEASQEASPSGTEEPEESRTPRPSSTPDASDTPEPSGSHD
jgi:hypothetical protein